ncbi:cuticular protein hypothetical 11 precursor [Danaus plexippus plexippus]|uniref:Cuticular protein hypothetical 11 n=1 Tax=Danaus plexippus plexippus TaxID=278856 RepID=A0A212FGE6_DANPL|nr:cuticular protein hypothetical 11 precursor [Danaus plexippus plexippus]
MMKLVVLSCVLAAASASSLLAGYVAPIAYAATYIQPSNYRGPLSLAPGQPANILGADGRPLDTLDVNLDRAAHYNSNGIHLLKKRSVVAIAPVSTVAVARTPLIASHYSYQTPIIASHLNSISYAAGPYTHIL